MSNNFNDDLDAQIAQLSGIDLSQATAEAPTAPQSAQPVAQPMQTQPVQAPTAQPVEMPTQPTSGFAQVPPQPMPSQQGLMNNTSVTGQQPMAQPIAQPVQPQNVSQTMPPIQQPVAQPYTQPVGQPMQAQPVTAQPSNANVDYKALNSRPVFADLNQQTRTQTPFLTVKKNEYARIILFTFNSLKDHIHYIDGLGTIRCLSHYNESDYPDSFASCCKFPTDDGKPNYAKRRQLMPVLKLPVAPQDGKTIVGNKVELKMWNMNILESQALTQILKDYSPTDDIYKTDLTTFDIMLYKDPSGQFAVNKVNAVPTIRQNFQGLNEEAAKLTDEVWDTAWEEMAKVVKEETVAAKLNEAIMMQQQVNMQMQYPQQPPTLNQALGYNVQ